MRNELAVRPVSTLGVDSRAAFINKVYLHLFGAIAVLVGIEAFIFNNGYAEPIARTLLNLPGGWMLVLGGFMLVGWLASHVSHTARSLPAQYAAFAGLILANAIILVPMLYVAFQKAPDVPQNAVMVTLIAFAGLTAVAFVTRKDFSFLRGILFWGFILAIVGIGASLLFGFSLGIWFTVAMLGFAGAAILYDTSNVLHHYPESQYVGASLQLFSSVALLFWYVLRFFMHSSD
ncbi:MAG: permease [Gammaproteobacteria bacterium]|nr:permease [Gammaproteobacteria bacterium]